MRLDSLNSSSDSTRALRHRVLFLLVILIAALLRFGGIDGAPEDWDALDFLLGVEDFDLVDMQPHLPGYPLYMLLARLICLAGAPPSLALEILGATAGTLTVLVIHRLLTSSGEWVALAGAALVGVQPALVAESPRMHSDTLGLFVVLLALYFVARQRRFTAGVFAGLALGVRLAYAPLALGLLLFVRWRGAGEGRVRGLAGTGTGRFVLGSICGLVVWGGPFLAVHGPEVLAEGGAFLRGHLLEWGGTPLAVDSPGVLVGVLSWVVTLGRVVIGWWPHSSLGLAASVLTGALIFAGCLRCRRPQGQPDGSWRGVLWVILPYLVWLFVGQNSANFRHALPVALFLAPLVAVGWLRRRRAAPLVLILLCLYGLSSVGYLLESRGTVAPGEALARYLDDELARDDRYELIYCGASYRFLRWRGLHYQLLVTRAVDYSGVIDDVSSRPEVPVEVLISSDVEDIPEDARPLISFSAPGYLRPRRLDLYRFLTRRGAGGLYGLIPEDTESQ